MKNFRKNDFNPDITHPYYFIRKGLYLNVKKLAPFMTGRMLDFGCGSKPYRHLFQVNEYIGIDFENEGHSHDFEQIDIYYDGKSIPFPESSFDCVLSSEVFEHIFNLDEVLAEIHRILKPHGHIIITCPFVWNEHETPHDYARYTVFALMDMAEKRGFETITVLKSGNFITTLFQLWALYLFQNLYPKIQKIFLLRWLFYFFGFIMSNLTGIVLSRLLPVNQTLYLNNVLLLRKK